MQLPFPVYQRVALAALLLLASGWYVYKRTHQPPLASVNGVYRSACCGDVELKDGLMLTGRDRVPFTLENMKFGLTGYPAQNVIVDRNQVKVVGGQTYTAISFSPDRKTLTLCGPSTCQHEYLFARK